jgi:hypothetical protein
MCPGSCALAIGSRINGSAAALPMRVMNSRRLMGFVPGEHQKFSITGLGADTCSASQRNRPLTPRHSGALLPSGGRVAGPEHDDFRADWRAVVEIDDVLVRQADTAGRDVGANGPGFIGAVDAV